MASSSIGPTVSAVGDGDQAEAESCNPESRTDSFPQSIFVIRHGVDHWWQYKAARPYDPPLTEKGVEQAKEAGKRFLDKVELTMTPSQIPLLFTSLTPL